MFLQDLGGLFVGLDPLLNPSDVATESLVHQVKRSAAVAAKPLGTTFARSGSRNLQGKPATVPVHPAVDRDISRLIADSSQTQFSRELSVAGNHLRTELPETSSHAAAD